MAKFIKNKLDKSFGPVGSSAGIFIFVVGMFFYLVGDCRIVAGSFCGL